MKYIKLKSVRLKGLRSFVDEQFISIPENGLIGIKGDSGAGKTNFHLAIAYAFGYAPLSQSELQSWEWLTDNKLRVELEFDTYMGPVTLVRGEGAYIKIGDKITNASAKAIAQELQKLLDIPLELIEALTFRPQGEPARFVSMTDAQKKEFLSKMLNLEIIEDEIEEWVKINNKTKADIDTLETVISTLKGQLVEPVLLEIDHNLIVELMANSVKLTLELKYAQDDKEDIEKEIQELEKAFKPDLTRLGELDNELQRTNQELATAERNLKELQDLAKEVIAELKKKSIPLSTSVNQLPIIKNQIGIKTKELNGILKSLCPTCEQTWIPQNNRKEELENELNQLAEKYCEFESLKDELDEIKVKIDQNTISLIDLQESPNISALKTKITSLKIQKNDELNNIKQQKEAALRDLNLELSQAKDKLNKVLVEHNTVYSELKLLNSRKADYERTNKAAQEAYDILAAKIKSKDKELSSLKEVWAVQSDYTDLLKSFLGSIFEDVLHEISTETNELLKHLPNVDTKTVQFVTERTTNKGTTRQEIRPVVMIKNQPCTLKSLSGGQGNSVGLAIDLAVSSVITKRTGIDLGWQVFDESFDGMDLKTKECCLELLKEAANNKVIFTIDHFSEINEMYEKILYIDTQDGVSVIREG